MGLSPAPIAATFPQAPLRSRKAGFPRSGSDLGFPSWAFPDSRRSLSTDIHTPHPRWFTHDLVPAFLATLPRLCVRGPPWDRQAPRAPSLQVGVIDMQKTSRVSSRNITSTSSLLRAHAPDRCPPVALGSASGSRSLQVAVSPCCATALPDAISADLSVRVWTPTPAAPRVQFPVSSPEALAFPVFGPGRRLTKTPTATSVGKRFRSCSHSIIFRPAHLLATPVAPTLTPFGAGQPWLLSPRISRFVTSPCSGYANRPNRVIGGKGTRTLQNRQPCRLLPKRELPQLDEKLYLEVFAQPDTSTPRRAGSRR